MVVISLLAPVEVNVMEPLFVKVIGALNVNAPAVAVSADPPKLNPAILEFAVIEEGAVTLLPISKLPGPSNVKPNAPAMIPL